MGEKETVVANSEQINRRLIPVRLQLAYCLIGALLISLFWCREQLASAYISSTQVSGSEVQASLIQAFSGAFNSRFLGILPLIIFWMLVGLAAAAIIYESANLIIALWNDYVIVSNYTNTDDFKHNLKKSFLVTIFYSSALVVFVSISIKTTAGVWYQLISQPVHGFFGLSAISHELLGIIGLTANIYLGWTWLLYLIPRFF